MPDKLFTITVPRKKPKNNGGPSKAGELGRTPGEALSIEIRREKAVTWYLQGVSQSKIARRLKVSQSTISKDIAEMRNAINERAAATTVQLQAEEIAKIDQVESTAWASFKKSQKKGRFADQGGNPKFLDIVLHCSDKRRQILGLDKQIGSTAQGLLEYLAQSLEDAPPKMPERTAPRPLFGGNGLGGDGAGDNPPIIGEA